MAFLTITMKQYSFIPSRYPKSSKTQLGYQMIFFLLLLLLLLLFHTTYFWMQRQPLWTVLGGWGEGGSALTMFFFVGTFWHISCMNSGP